MTTQFEAQIEANLAAQLLEQGYDSVHIPDEAAMVQNLKTQIEAHNNASFSNDCFGIKISDGMQKYIRRHRQRFRDLETGSE